MLIQTLIRVAIIPGFVVGLVFLLARLTPQSLRLSLRGAGLCAGFLFGYILLLGMPSWPPAGSPSALVPAAIAASIWPIVELGALRRFWFKRYLFLLLIAFLVLKPLVTTLWSQQESVSTLITLTTAAVLSWFLVERGSEKMSVPATYAILVNIAAGLSFFMLMTGSAMISQLTGVVCSIIGVILVLSLIGWVQVKYEALPFIVAMLFGLLMAHLYYVETSLTPVYVLLSPIALFLLRSFKLWKFKSSLADALTMGLISALPIAYQLYVLYMA